MAGQAKQPEQDSCDRTCHQVDKPGQAGPDRTEKVLFLQTFQEVFPINFVKEHALMTFLVVVLNKTSFLMLHYNKNFFLNVFFFITAPALYVLIRILL